MSTLMSQLQLFTNPVTANNDNVLVISYIPTDVNFHMSFVQPFRFFIRNIRCF